MRFVRWALGVGFVVYLLGAGGLYFLQRQLVFAPDATRIDPATAGFPASVLQVSTADGERLVAWHAPPKPGKKLALYFHGNGGALKDRGFMFRALGADGTGILAIDYRGYGGSTGAPSEEGFYRDADAAYEKALALGYAPQDILAVGASLGAGVAVKLASHRDVAGVVLDSPYSSTLDIAADKYWMFPVALLMRDPFRADLAIGKLRAPILMFHGDADRTIPVRYGERLYALAPPPKEFVRVAGADHIVLHRPESIAKLREWVGGLDRLAGK